MKVFYSGKKVSKGTFICTNCGGSCVVSVRKQLPLCPHCNASGFVLHK